jgi:hypothetical protein
MDSVFQSVRGGIAGARHGHFRLSNKNGAVALVALNSPIDGQFGYSNVTGEEIPWTITDSSI